MSGVQRFHKSFSELQLKSSVGLAQAGRKRDISGEGRQRERYRRRNHISLEDEVKALI